MRILPISNNNLYSQKKQINPSFGARIDKSLVEQMSKQSAPLKNLSIRTVTGAVLSLPAVFVAKMSLKPEAKFAGLDINSFPHNDLYNMYMEQDENGQTLAHKQLTSDILKTLIKKLTPEQFEKIVTVKDKDGIAPLERESSKYEVLAVINDSKMPLASAINIISTNNLDNEIKSFLQFRLEKQKEMGIPISSHVNNRMFESLMNSVPPYNVDTKTETYFELDSGTAAKFFNMSENNEFAVIDESYFPYATVIEIEDITVGAQSGSEKALRELFHAIKTLPVEKQAPIIEEIIARMDKDTLLTREHTEAVREVLGETAFEKLHRILYDDGRTILHNSVYYVNSNSKTIDDSDDFKYHFDKLKEFNPELLKEIILMKNKNGALDVMVRDGIVRYIFEEYKQEPEMLKKILMNQDNDGDTFLHNADLPMVEETFKVLNNEDLAEALSVKNDKNETPMKSQDVIDDNFIYKRKILELATDSDLSIDKSISLLEANDMEPQIVEFLKLQKAALDNAE